jgi:hypothetical protein
MVIFRYTPDSGMSIDIELESGTQTINLFGQLKNGVGQALDHSSGELELLLGRRDGLPSHESAESSARPHGGTY